MGKMKDLAIQIEENDCEDFMAFNLGITMEELKLLNYETYISGGGFTRTVVFDLEKCPKEIMAKIKNLENGIKVNYSLIDLKKLNWD
jgi:hypothetical protein